MISPVTSSAAVVAVEPLSIESTPQGAKGAFQQVLTKAIDAVSSTREAAGTELEKFLSGEGPELHRVIMAAQQAELSFEMFQSVRNKVVQAYQEVMRMQL